MLRQNLCRRFAVAFLVMALGACALSDDKQDYRSRLTVELDTPEGVRTGSSVIGVETLVASSRSIPTPGAVRHRVAAWLPVAA